MRVVAAACSALLLSWSIASAADPKVPPGTDPGGVPVALFTQGLDYTRADVARTLARDGEGEMIGWDLVDNDRRPFATSALPGSSGGDLAVKLASAGGIKVIPIRVDAADSASLARAIGYASRTPARVVVMPFTIEAKAADDLLSVTVNHFVDLIIVVGAPSPSMLRAAANVVAIAPKGGAGGDATVDQPGVAEAVVRSVAIVLGCRRAMLSGPGAKADFLKALSAGGADTSLAGDCAPGSSGEKR